MKNIKVTVTEMLKNFGIGAHLKGYHYLRTAFELIAEDSLILEKKMALYYAIAKKHNTTASRVERAIRHAIENAWTHGDVDLQETIFGYTIEANKGKPTNSLFISTVADYLQLLEE